jgi:cell division protein ZapA
MDKNKIRLIIGGLDYYLTTDDEVAYMKNLGEELDEDISELLRDHPRLSQVQAAVFCALDYSDKYRKSEKNADYLKTQIQVYMEDAAKAKTEAEMARRETERMTRDLRSIRRSIEEKEKHE